MCTELTPVSSRALLWFILKQNGWTVRLFFQSNVIFNYKIRSSDWYWYFSKKAAWYLKLHYQSWASSIFFKMPRKYYIALSSTVNKQAQIITETHRCEYWPCTSDVCRIKIQKGNYAHNTTTSVPMTSCVNPLQSIAPPPYRALPLSSTLPSVILCSCQSQLPQQHWCLSILGECRHTPKLLNGQAKNSSGWIWLGWFMRLWVIQLCRGLRRARERSEWALKEKKWKFARLLRHKTTEKCALAYPINEKNVHFMLCEPACL